MVNTLLKLLFKFGKDTSKQGFSMFTQHMFNVWISLEINKQVENKDECAW